MYMYTCFVFFCNIADSTNDDRSIVDRIVFIMIVRKTLFKRLVLNAGKSKKELQVTKIVTDIGLLRQNF